MSKQSVEASEVELVARPRAGAPSRSEADDSFGERTEEADTLRSLQELLMRFPLATQAAFSALVAEGRHYAGTPDGARLLQELTHSKRAHRARVVWEILTLSGITDQKTHAVPSVFLDKMARTLVFERLEPILARLFDRKLKAE
jgi:hypothetical protein